MEETFMSKYSNKHDLWKKIFMSKYSNKREFDID